MNLSSQQEISVQNGKPVAVNVAGTECVVVRKDIYLRLAEDDNEPWTVEEMNLLADEAEDIITQGEANED